MDFIFSKEFLFLAIGQLSFILGAISFWVKGSLNLRIWQICSGVLGIFFNWNLATSGNELSFGLISVVFWLTVFLGLNCHRSYELIIRKIEKPLERNLKSLFSSAMPLATTYDVDTLAKAAKEISLSDNQLLMDYKQVTQDLMLVKDGALIEHLPSGQKRLLTKGNWIGDAAFLVNDSVAGSQSKITCSGKAILMVWGHKELQTLCEQSETLLPALTDAVAVSMAHKGNFLHLDRSLGASVSLVEPALTVEQMDLHAEVFPRLTASGFELLLSHAEVHHVKQGEILEFDQTLACVLSGKLVGLDDNNEVMDVVLDRYDLIGEFGLFAPERKSGFAKRLRAAEDTHFIQWAWSSLEEIEVQAPAVYTRILKSISRALILKVIDRTDVAIAN